MFAIETRPTGLILPVNHLLNATMKIYQFAILTTFQVQNDCKLHHYVPKLHQPLLQLEQTTPKQKLAYTSKNSF